MDIVKEYKNFCSEKGINFNVISSAKPYDETTLFCPAGMQQFKKQFNDVNFKGTFANVQSCIRMNDFSQIGDLTHLLYFNMIGLFSFREMTIEGAIHFWVSFLNRIGIKPDYVTVHSNRQSWSDFYNDLGINNIKIDDDNCKWSDGEIGGYCTEFFVNNIEIGNIVNPLDNCIDVGFGLERLEMIINNKKIDKITTLKETAIKIIESGYKPSNLKQGYVLRKLLREIYKLGETLEHKFFVDEMERQKKIVDRYEKLKNKFADKSKGWWYETHGINLDDL